VRYGLSFLTTEYICVFYTVLTVNSDCFPKPLTGQPLQRRRICVVSLGDEFSSIT
jgi:hypothetical protein